MIKVNDKIINQERFGDNTLKIGTIFPYREFSAIPSIKITWCYDNDSELFALQCIVDHYKECYPRGIITLELPYIPNARQDRKVSNRLFTLKSFANIINSMEFDYVLVLDPHSDVSKALINNVEEDMPIITEIDQCVYDAIMFPDNGAAKKYLQYFNNNCKDIIIGNKHRNDEGRIDSYELINFKDGVEKVLIVDDICSYGGTFISAAKALREKGVKRIDLAVSHCEENIFKGQVFDYINKIFTTDSILDLNNMSINVDEKILDKIIFLKRYRNEN